MMLELAAMLLLGAAGRAAAASEAGEGAVTDAVRQMYEKYPFPSHEADTIVPAGYIMARGSGYIGPSHLPEISHFVFGGTLETDARFQEGNLAGRPLNVLFAGGGTGQTALTLARQLEAVPGLRWRLTIVDLTAASLAVARRRFEVNGLLDKFEISLQQGSLLEPAALAGLGGPFDYIDVAGVLHHTPAPEVGLTNLAAVLAPGGGLGVMLYGKLGRSGLYEFREQMRLLGGAEATDAKVQAARELLRALPASHPLVTSPNDFGAYGQMDDEELVDTLLHSHDVPFDVPGLYRLAGAAGLAFAGFAQAALYEPCSYLARPAEALCRRTLGLPRSERQAFAELLAGNICSHEFYLVRPPPETDEKGWAATAAQLGPTSVPVPRVAPETWEALQGSVAAQAAGGLVQAAVALDYIGAKMAWPVSPADKAAELMALMKGNAAPGARWTVRELCAEAGLVTAGDWSGSSCQATMEQLYTPLSGMGWLVLSSDRVGWEQRLGVGKGPKPKTRQLGSKQKSRRKGKARRDGL
jgi:SAM-dependent methyltransferase